MPDSLWIIIPSALLAGMVRGYAGFGFAAIAIVGFNLVIDPQQSIPLVLALDIICSAGLLRQAIHQADMPTFKLLVGGAITGIPVGMGLLLLIPGNLLKLIICIIILLLSLLLMSSFRLNHPERTHVKLLFGTSSGIGTAAASVGGPMIVCYMLSSALSASTQRATMILFFVVSETLAIGALFAGGLVTSTVFHYLLIILLPTLIAVRAGQALFNRYPPASLKHFALPILLLVSVLGISASLRALV